MKLKTAIIFIFSFFILTSPVQAQKKLTRRTQATPTPTNNQAWDKLKLRSDKHAILLVLGGMKHTDTVSYQLTYTADSVPQGIESYHTPSDGNTQKELVFGTCSGSDCTYHQNITDMEFQIKFKLKDGHTITKKYQINLDTD